MAAYHLVATREDCDGPHQCGIWCYDVEVVMGPLSTSPSDAPKEAMREYPNQEEAHTAAASFYRRANEAWRRWLG